MDITFILLFIAGITIPIASAVAVITDRFDKVAASIMALAAGLPPLLFLFMWNYGSMRGQMILLFAMFGSGPLLLLSFFLYGVGMTRQSS